jgi:hypothetical protein
MGTVGGDSQVGTSVGTLGFEACNGVLNAHFRACELSQTTALIVSGKLRLWFTNQIFYCNELPGGR